MPTANTEDYLRCIYKLQLGDEPVATSEIAAALKIKAPSATDMVQRLAQNGLVHYRRYGGVRLTPAGKRLALSITRRHRLWEMFLVRTLNFSWDEVHALADLLEHVTPESLEDRIDAFLGRPAADPHGDLIPSKSGALPRRHEVCLADCPVGTKGTVVRVADENAAALQMLSHHEIKLARVLSVTAIAPYDGSMQLKMGTRQIFLSRELASTIFVRVGKRT